MTRVRQWSFENSGGAALVTATPGQFPLVVSPDSHGVNQANGTPFLMNGEAAWSLNVNTSSADTSTYLADAQSKGITLIMLSLIEHMFSEQTPLWRNKAGDDPFTGTISAGNPDFTTPNEPYWAHVDFIFSEAAKYGLVVLALPCYLGFQLGSEGWGSVVSANTASRMTTYGTFLGNRYKNVPNLIWCMGGDSGPIFGATNLTTHINNLANAIKAVDTAHLMTAHPNPGEISTDSYNQSWLDLIAAYPIDNTDLDARVKAAYQASPTKPCFMVEGYYGNEHTMTDVKLRIEMYQSVLGGGLGHIYSNSPLWYFGVNASASGNAFADTGGLDWHTQLSSFGANFLTYVRRLQVARPLATLAPDYAHAFVTAGFGASGITYAPVLASNRILVAYTNGVALTVAKGQFVSATFNVNWYNVRDGSTTSGGTVAMGSGSQVFTPPTTGGGNDWVLLLDDQALSLSNP